MELLTTKQKEREARDKELARIFADMKATYPTASSNRILTEMEGTNTLTRWGIRAALIRQGIKL